MIELRDVSGELYVNTSLDTQMIYYAGLSEEETNHPLSFELSENCEEALAEQLQEKLIPLFRLDIADLNPDLEGKIPVFYHELVSMRWIVSRLDEEGRAEEMFLVDTEGNSFGFDELDSEYDVFFTDGADTVLESLSPLEGQYLEIWSEEPTEPLGDLRLVNADAIGDWARVNVIAATEASENTKYPVYWGPMVGKVQTELSVPVDEESHEDIAFVGQFNARELFGLRDHTYYLFYNPEQRIVAQLMQTR